MSVADFTAQLELKNPNALQLVYRMLGQPNPDKHGYIPIPDKHGYIYAFVCADMPHLVKIGRTVNLVQRLRDANSHDTYKPPTGYTSLAALFVDDMYRCEHELHQQFAYCRQKNAHGNSTEFFKVDPVQVQAAFAQIQGIPADAKSEVKNVRPLLHHAVETHQPCAYRLANPKNPGSKCHARYELYKCATSMNEALKLGTFEDIVYDYNAGFLCLK